MSDRFSFVGKPSPRIFLAIDPPIGGYPGVVAAVARVEGKFVICGHDSDDSLVESTKEWLTAFVCKLRAVPEFQKSELIVAHERSCGVIPSLLDTTLWDPCKLANGVDDGPAGSWFSAKATVERFHRVSDAALRDNSIVFAENAIGGTVEPEDNANFFAVRAACALSLECDA